METLDDDCEWPKQFQEIKKIDSLLRCSICFEFFNIAVVVPACSHNYCSYCIRKHILYKKHCPTCYIPLLDTDLKCNRVLDELVLYFKIVRKKLLDILNKFYSFTGHSDGPNDVSKCTEIYQDAKIDSDEFEPVPNFRIAAKPSSQKKTSKISKKQKETIISNDLNKCFAFHNTTTGNPSNLGDVACCPVCNDLIPIKRINIHLDGCLKAKERSLKTVNMKSKQSEMKTLEDAESKMIEDAEDDEIHFSSLDIEVAHDQHENYTKSCDKQENISKRRVETANDLILSSATILMKPLAKVCLDSLSEKQLRNKAKSFGLPIKGDRKALTQRFNRYILLYNSQCDSSKPLSAQEIATEVLNQEKQLEIHGYKANVLPQTFDLRYSEDRKQEYALNYSSQYNKEFVNHIETIKSRKKMLQHHAPQSSLGKPLNQSESEESSKNDFLIKDNQLNKHDCTDVKQNHPIKTHDVKQKLYHPIKTQENIVNCVSSFYESRVKKELITEQSNNEEPIKNDDILNSTMISFNKNCLNNSFKMACSPIKLEKNSSCRIKSPLFSSPFENDNKITKDQPETDGHRLSPVSENIKETKTSETINGLNQLLSVDKDNQYNRKQLAKKSSVNPRKRIKRSNDSECMSSNKKARKSNSDIPTSDTCINKVDVFHSLIEISDSDSETLFHCSGLSDESSLLVDEAAKKPFYVSENDSSSDSCLVPDVPNDFELISSFKF